MLLDVFRAVVVPRSAGTRYLGLALSGLMLAYGRRRAGRLPIQRRHDVMGGLGPFMVVLEMLAWVVALILGYGLLFHAMADGMRPPPDFGDALYAAGASFLTLGLNGQEAISGPVRFLCVFAGLTGYGIVTLVITFLLNVHTALGRREALVVTLAARVGDVPSAVRILTLYARLLREDPHALMTLFQSWEDWSADVLLSHRAYPVLVLFRSTDAKDEWLATLGAMLDAAALVAACGRTGMEGHARLFHHLGTRVVQNLAALTRVRQTEMTGPGFPDYSSVVAQLRRDGLNLGDTEADWANFIALRGAHAPAIQGLSARFGVTPTVW